MDPRCRGTNNLIKQGAFLIEDINDVLDVIKVSLNRPTRAEELHNPLLNFYKKPPLENLRSIIIDALSSAPISFDDLVMSINASASEITAEITLLEIEGIIKRDHDLLTKA
jgi:DNA processing protein